MKLSKLLDFVALDIETTGLSEQKDEIIEIAAIRFKGGIVTEVFDSFVRPRGRVPKFIQFLTHISIEQLSSAPELKEVLGKLKQFVGKSPLVGHNIAFDMGFINHNMVMTGDFPLLNERWDTADVSRIYYPFTTDHKLGTMVRYCGITLENAHRADADATATGYLLLKMADHITDHYTMVTNSRILSLARMAQLESCGFLELVLEHQKATAISAPPTAKVTSPYFNLIDNSIPATPNPAIDSVFGENGLFAHSFPNFEFRYGQVQMAKAVEEAFKKSEHLVVEAGTGVGKSFAYLVPSLEFAHRNKSKVVVSTNTKNLQEQLFFKDLPQLKKILPVPFKAVLVKGRENYVCERRWEEMVTQRELSAWDAQSLLHLYIWKMHTLTGDVSENSSFDRSRYSITWHKVCSDRYLCGNRKCMHYKKCHVMSLRKEIEDASVVVANHALLLSDLRMENTTLGEYNYLVVDEAHNLMASASKHLGSSLSYTDAIVLFNQLSSSSKKSRSGYLSQLAKALEKSVLTEEKKNQLGSQAEHLAKVIDTAKAPLMDLFNMASAKCSAANSYNKLRIKTVDEGGDIFHLLDTFGRCFKDIINATQALHNILSSMESKQVPAYEQHMENLDAFGMRLREMEGVILTILNPDLENFALWIENNPKPDRNVPAAVLNYAPVEVNSYLCKTLYEDVPSIVFTSATLAIRGSFKYFMNQSGLGMLTEKNVVQTIVDSPFDYDEQSKLLIGGFLPEPKDKFFPNQALNCLKQIFHTVDVGTMTLFTSYRDLDAAFDFVADDLYHSSRSLYAQGKGGSRSSILEEFKRAKNAVLLGTSSFWEGVDVQGESLSLLIIYKIPFQVPSEPLVEAYIDKLERENKDSFMHYMLPNALLRIRQGFGRLIRSTSDRGLVLILDSRVSKKYYGSFFKEILPGQHIDLKSEVQMLDEITRFFK